MKTVRIALGALVLVAILIFVIVKATGGGHSDNSGSTGAVGLTEAQLVDKSAGLGHIFYWVGPRPNTDSYEFTSTTDGRIYVRYLTGGANPGDPRADFISVGTYVVHNARNALDQAAASAHSKVISQDGYEFLPGSKNDAYVVFDSEPDLQVEVYSPKAGEALQLATSGHLTQVGR